MHGRLAAACLEPLAAAAGLLARSLAHGGTILSCGNGGSATESQHLAAELVGRLTRERRRAALAAVALTANPALLTAVANDEGFERVFARQVEALGRPGDVLVAISTSGASPNVLAAVAEARRRGLRTVALTGGSGGPLAAAVEVAVVAPGASTPRVQEAHAALVHALCAEIEELLAEEPVAAVRPRLWAMAPGTAGGTTPAVFLDRDGTLMPDLGYPADAEAVTLLEGVPEALSALRAAGLRLVLVSNQSGVGRGLVTPSQARAVHERLEALLAAAGVVLDGVYYCFHAPADRCGCRKPSPAMLLAAAGDLELDLARSFAVGDQERDLEAGRRAGCAAVRFDPAAGRGWPAAAAEILAAYGEARRD